jgi:hypothetical protein
VPSADFVRVAIGPMFYSCRSMRGKCRSSGRPSAVWPKEQRRLCEVAQNISGAAAYAGT